MNDATRPVTVLNRREFVGVVAGGGAALAAQPVFRRPAAPRREFKLSLAAWSLHREVRTGKLKLIDACQAVREEFGLDGFELVNTLLEVPTADYVRRFRKEADRFGLAIPLVMCDGEGEFGSPDAAERRKAVRYHAKWVYAASDLGCHSIRVNWRGAAEGSEKNPAQVSEFIDRSVDAFGEMVALAQRYGISVIIENHGGPSSYPDALVGLMRAVNSPAFGTLPDWGNFPREVNRYDAVDRMMPYAKGVSAKCYDFWTDGRETSIDFERMLQICVDQHNYHGFIGIEYEGERLSEREGVIAARDLLVKLKGV